MIILLTELFRIGEPLVAGLSGLLIGWLSASFFKVSRVEFKEYVLDVNRKLDEISHALPIKVDRQELKEAMLLLREDIKEIKAHLRSESS